jgi:hypothetical protein
VPARLTASAFLAPTRDGDGQNRNWRQAHQLLGDAAQEQVGEAGAPVGAEYHQIVLPFLQLREQGGGRFKNSAMSCSAFSRIRSPIGLCASPGRCTITASVM